MTGVCPRSAAYSLRAQSTVAVLTSLLLLCGASQPSRAQNIVAATPECRQSGSLRQGCAQIVFDGDSIAASQRATPGHELYTRVMRSLKEPARIYEVAVGGRPVIDCLSHFRQDIIPLSDNSTRVKLIIFHAGDNDIRIGRTAAETYAAFTDYVRLAHAYGWKILVSTEMPRPDFRAAQAVELATYNRLLLANHADADSVVDVNTDPRFSDLAGRTEPSSIFSSDRLHPNDAGYALLAQMLALAAEPLLRR